MTRVILSRRVLLRGLLAGGVTATCDGFEPAPALGAEDSDNECFDLGSHKKAIMEMPVRNTAFVGFDKRDVPDNDMRLAPEDGMRWIYMVSNLRFVAIYLQGKKSTHSHSKDVLFRMETETDSPTITKGGKPRRPDRGWMKMVPHLTDYGWGLVPVYFGQCANSWLPPENEPPPQRQAMSDKVGRAHAIHVKNLMAKLTENIKLTDGTYLDLAGAVVYVDNEDQSGEQRFDQDPADDDPGQCLLTNGGLRGYLEYYRTFAEELATPDEKGRAYRFGIYCRPAPAKRILSVVPNAYLWMSNPLFDGEKRRPDGTKLDLDEDGLVTHIPVPLAVKGSKEWAPKRQIWLQNKDESVTTWPVLRQFVLHAPFPQDPPPPFSRTATIDLNTSYVFDPSEPIATPRLAYIPDTTLLVRLWVNLAVYEEQYNYKTWRAKRLLYTRRGSLTIVKAGSQSSEGKEVNTYLDAPADRTKPHTELHPESPVVTACDSLNRFLVAAIQRSRSVVIGEVVLGSRRPMEVIPETEVRRPLALGLAALGEDAVIAYPTRDHRILLHTKHWPDGKWAKHQVTGKDSLHPFGGFAAAAFPGGDHVFLASVARSGEFLVTIWSAKSGPIPGKRFDTALSVTSAIAAVTPTGHDDLAFGITNDGRLMMVFHNHEPSPPLWGAELSGRRLFIHSRLGVVRESKDRVHIAGIDPEGNFRRWGVRRNNGSIPRDQMPVGLPIGGWFLENSDTVGIASSAAPNPWTDVALACSSASAGREAFAVVAGVDEYEGNPEQRGKAFRTRMSIKNPADAAELELTQGRERWRPIPNPKPEPPPR